MPPRKRGYYEALYDLESSNLTPSPSYPSSLSTSQPGSSTNTVKNSTKKRRKDPDAPEPEKRDARFKKSCPKNILDRVDRVMSQRFFLVERRREGKELREEFSVLGSTGNVYTVTIDKFPSCTCPDALKGNHCKHILFVYLKVLQVPQHSSHWYQKALLTDELAEIFHDAPLAPNVLANSRIREAYAKATGKELPEGSSSNDNGKRRPPDKDDDCPICYEAMFQLPESTLEFCDKCGNALHKECFKQWTRSAPKPTCVYCRAQYAPPRASSAAGPSSRRGAYVNLSAEAGVSPVRDTSTYYHGPRRGENSYGYGGSSYDYDPFD